MSVSAGAGKGVTAPLTIRQRSGREVQRLTILHPLPWFFLRDARRVRAVMNNDPLEGLKDDLLSLFDGWQRESARRKRMKLPDHCALP